MVSVFFFCQSCCVHTRPKIGFLWFMLASSVSQIFYIEAFIPYLIKASIFCFFVDDQHVGNLSQASSYLFITRIFWYFGFDLFGLHSFRLSFLFITPFCSSSIRKSKSFWAKKLCCYFVVCLSETSFWDQLFRKRGSLLCGPIRWGRTWPIPWCCHSANDFNIRLGKQFGD